MDEWNSSKFNIKPATLAATRQHHWFWVPLSVALPWGVSVQIRLHVPCLTIVIGFTRSMICFFCKLRANGLKHQLRLWFHVLSNVWSMKLPTTWMCWDVFGTQNSKPKFSGPLSVLQVGYARRRHHPARPFGVHWVQCLEGGEVLGWRNATAVFLSNRFLPPLPDAMFNASVIQPLDSNVRTKWIISIYEQ